MCQASRRLTEVLKCAHVDLSLLEQSKCHGGVQRGERRGVTVYRRTAVIILLQVDQSLVIACMYVHLYAHNHNHATRRRKFE